MALKESWLRRGDGYRSVSRAKTSRDTLIPYTTGRMRPLPSRRSCLKMKDRPVGGLRSGLIPAGAILLLLLSLLSPSLTARDRNAARAAYQTASEYHSNLLARSAEQRTLNQYQRAIHLFRLVIDHDPTYGACDDALFAIAGLYEEMARRYQSDSYRKRAIYYYEFVAREYPTTPWRSQALSSAKQLKNSPSAPPPAPVARSTAAPASSRERSSEVTPVAAQGFGIDPDHAVLTQVRYWSNEDYTRVVLQLDREVRFEKSILSNPDRIYFDLQETRLMRQGVDRSYDVNGLFLKQIRVAQNRAGVVRVVLDFDAINRHTVFALYDPYRIVIDTRGHPDSNRHLAENDEPEPIQTAEGVIPLSTESEEEPREVKAALPVPASPSSNGDYSLIRTLGLKVGRVVIDPGHGGRDTGTIGPSGLLEKDLVLDVSRRLKELLEKRLGLDVILTRSDDRFIPLEERTAIANQKGADLFISIHANASRNRRVSGIETFVLDFATTPAEQEVASRENASAQRTIRELEDLLKQIALGDYNQESRDLASAIQTSLFEEVRRHRPANQNRGVKQAPFIVLMGSNMPSILTEIGFISNPEDEAFFRRDDSRDSVALALFRGVEGYFRSLGAIPDPSRAASASSP